MLPPLDRDSDLALHVQIEQALRRLIRQRAYRNGKPLPTEVELAGQLKVSRNTIRAAMARLKAEGLLHRTPRVGTRVATGKPHTSLAQWHSFSREMRSQGIEVVNFALSLSRVPADAEVAAALGIARGSRIWRLRRLRGWNGSPALLALSWLHPSLGITGNEDFERPLYEVLCEVAGVRPARSREEIAAVAADAALARELGVAPGQPLLLRRRTILDEAGRPLEHNVNYYRADRHQLTLDLQGP